MLKFIPILIATLLISTHTLSQVGFNQLKSYIHLSYDTLDDIFSRKGYTFEQTYKPDNNSSNSIWKDKRGNWLGILSTADTVSLMLEDLHVGYIDVTKKSIMIISSDASIYTKLLTEIKNSMKKFQSYTEGAKIITNYKNDKYFITVTKERNGTKISYTIEILDLANELGEKHFIQ